jgi:hypothetical protein
MILNAIQRKAVQPVRPGLDDSSGRRIELRNRFEPAWFGSGRDRGARNQPEFHHVGGQGLQKSDELCVAAKSSGKAKTTSMRRGR